MGDGRGFAVDGGGGAGRGGAIGFADGLVAEADAEDGDVRAEFFDGVDADARILGRARAGGDDDGAGLKGGDVFECDLVIADDLGCFASVFEIASQVVGEGIVIINNQEHMAILMKGSRKGSGFSRSCAWMHHIV
jgi:hypothetical protein